MFLISLVFLRVPFFGACSSQQDVGEFCPATHLYSNTVSRPSSRQTPREGRLPALYFRPVREGHGREGRHPPPWREVELFLKQPFLFK